MSTKSGAGARYTIAFDATAEAAMQDVMRTTNCKTVPDVVRTALSCFIDLLDVEEQRMLIVFRDEASGAEWTYSPLKPSRAVRISEESKDTSDGFPRVAQNVVKIGMAAAQHDAPADNVHPLPQGPRRRRR